MATTQLDVPRSGAVVFDFEELWTPEGTLRVTLWRPQLEHDRVVFYGKSVTNDKSPQDLAGNVNVYHNIHVKLAGRLLTTLPIHEEEAENYFSEITTHGFDLGIYNTLSPADIISVEQDKDGGMGSRKNLAVKLGVPVSYSTGETFVGTDARLLWKYIKPFESTELFGKWEFKADGIETWDTPEIGECQSAIEGQDYRWEHAQWDNPYLDERLNAPLDADEIFTFKFIHIAHSALDRVPVKPYNLSDPPDPIPDTWGMPIYNVHTNANASLPWTPSVVGNGMTTAPCVNAVGETSGADVFSLKWIRHIDARYWLHLVFDFAFGADEWVFTCEDAPIKLEGSRILNGDDGANFILIQNPITGHSPDPQKLDQSPASSHAGSVYTVNVEGFCPPAPIGKGGIFLPQSLWSVLDDLTIRPTYAPWPDAPVLESSWPKYLQSQWDVIREFCMMFGWIPLIGRNSDGKVTIHFKARTEPFETVFTGPVPSAATPTAFPESENGIAIAGVKTFLNARNTDGWYDDLLAFKYDATNDPDLHEFFDDAQGTQNVVKTLSNPYVIPVTAQEPATLNTLMRAGGYQYYYNPPGSGSGFPAKLFIYAASTAGASIDSGVNYPMTTPLVPGLGPTIVTTHYNPDLLALDSSHMPVQAFDYEPVLRVSFDYVDGKGQTQTTTCRSWRQALARFYGLLFVRSDKKYTVTDLTINQFWLINQTAPQKNGDPEIGDRYGIPSWRNCGLFNQRMFPDGRRGWCKHKKIDFNSMSTDTEYLRISERNSYIGIGGNFKDDEEDTGKINTPTIENNEGPSVTGSKSKI